MARAPGRGGVKGEHPANFRDRAREVYDDLTIIKYLYTEHGQSRKAIWLCRCNCGRPDCRREVRLSSCRLLERRWRWCGGTPRGRVEAPLDGAEASVLLPEGVRAPWDRPTDERARHDARLLHAFAAADLR